MLGRHPRGRRDPLHGSRGRVSTHAPAIMLVIPSNLCELLIMELLRLSRTPYYRLLVCIVRGSRTKESYFRSGDCPRLARTTVATTLAVVTTSPVDGRRSSTT